MIAAYLDESGIHAGSTAFAIGGWVAPATDWTIFEGKWKRILERYRGAIPKEKFRFHAADCESRHGDYEGWTTAKRDSFKEELTTLLVNSPLVGAGCSTDRRKHALYGPREKEAHDKLGGPFTPILLVCISLLARQSRTFVGEGGPVAFVFDRQKEFAARALFIYEQLRMDKHPNEEFTPLRDLLGPLVFEDSWRFVPLQAADLLAYETYKALLAKLDGSTRRPRLTLQRLKATGRVTVKRADFVIRKKGTK